MNEPDCWYCPVCKMQGVGVDEDGCCRMCGADCEPQVFDRATADKREAAFRELIAVGDSLLAETDGDNYRSPSAAAVDRLRAAIAAARAVVGEG